MIWKKNVCVSLECIDLRGERGPRACTFVRTSYGYTVEVPTLARLYACKRYQLRDVNIIGVQFARQTTYYIHWQDGLLLNLLATHVTLGWGWHAAPTYTDK